MKAFFIFAMVSVFSASIVAKDINPLEANSVNPISEVIAENNFNQEMKVTYLSKLVARQQKSCDQKVNFLETELRKTQDRLIEKSLDQETNKEAMIIRYKAEALNLKRELAYKTKALFEIQRQIEKMKPSEDLKNIIKLNTELTSELRRTENQMAVIQLKKAEGTSRSNSKARFPASVNQENK